MASATSSATSLETRSSSNSRAHRLGQLTYFAVLLLLSLSIVLNVLLARRLNRLISSRGQRWISSALHIGASVPPISAKTADGHNDIIVFTGTSKPTVLYVFTPECSWCARNMNNFKALIAAKADEDRFVGLSLSEEGLSTYIETYQLAIPVFTALSSETKKAYALGVTPQTIIVSPQGRILQNWPGAWSDKRKAEVEAFFHVRLPGVDRTVSVPKSMQHNL